tara:strand:- start:2400 stop:2687 length:288 start_codon:yes stop_codon:yes gene_type:complete
MNDTNQVQKALESKAKKELAKVVDEFLVGLVKLDREYRQPCFYYMKEHGGDEANKFNCMSRNSVESTLNQMLQTAYLEAMVSKKTQELLTKLELL